MDSIGTLCMCPFVCANSQRNLYTWGPGLLLDIQLRTPAWFSIFRIVHETSTFWVLDSCLIFVSVFLLALVVMMLKCLINNEVLIKLKVFLMQLGYWPFFFLTNTSACQYFDIGKSRWFWSNSFVCNIWYRYNSRCWLASILPCSEHSDRSLSSWGSWPSWIWQLLCRNKLVSGDGLV